jgi:hypothetical protein
VFHTAGLPPSKGSAILPNIGSTTNNKVAPMNMAAENRISTGMLPQLSTYRL